MMLKIFWVLKIITLLSKISDFVVFMQLIMLKEATEDV